MKSEDLIAPQVNNRKAIDGILEITWKLYEKSQI